VGFNPLPDYQEPERSPLGRDAAFAKEYPLILGTGSRNYYYTHSQHRGVAALREKSPEPLAELGPHTALSYGIKSGDLIEVRTNRGRVRMKAKVEDRLAEGVVLVPHGWPGESNANLLTDVDCRECILGYPDMKSLMCAVARV
jgi:anaerobic selenocysteine-containing dehydrogenase